MPNIDGLELMEEIRRRRIDVPVIFVTGYGEVESYMDLMNMGAFDYLNKPIDPKELFRVVESALEGCSGEDYDF
jgi:FixJ family two-component response regulator